jgi:hypothetical protein
LLNTINVQWFANASDIFIFHQRFKKDDLDLDLERNLSELPYELAPGMHKNVEGKVRGRRDAHKAKTVTGDIGKGEGAHME